MEEKKVNQGANSPSKEKEVIFSGLEHKGKDKKNQTKKLENVLAP